MSVLMRPTLFPIQKNFMLLRYIGKGKILEEFSKVIHTRFIASNQCSRGHTHAVMDLYSKCEAPSSATQYFNQMNKQNIDSWSGLMWEHFQYGFDFEVVRLFKSMVSDHESCSPDEYISELMLASCLNVGCLLSGRLCHGYLLKSGLAFNEYVITSLVHLYSMLSDVVGAMEVIVSDNKLDSFFFTSYLDSAHLDDQTLIIFRRMVAEDIVWNKATYIGIFGLCARLEDLDLGYHAHTKLLKSDFKFDESLCIAVIKMYVKCGDTDNAIKVIDQFEHPNVVLWTTLMAAYLEEDRVEESLATFWDMQDADVVPNESTFSVILKVSAELYSLIYGNLFHALAVKTGCNDHKNVVVDLITMYSKLGDVKAAEKVFLGTTYRDRVTLNTMIAKYCRHGLGHETLALFQEMLKSGVDPDDRTFIGVMQACMYVGLMDEGLHYLYVAMKEKGIEPGVEHYMCILGILLRDGLLDDALDFIVSTPLKWCEEAWLELMAQAKLDRARYLYGEFSRWMPYEVADKIAELFDVKSVPDFMRIWKVERPLGLSRVDIRNETYEIDPIYKKGNEDFAAVDVAMRRLLDHTDVEDDEIIKGQ